MNGTFKNRKTGETILPEDQREYVLSALGLAVVAEKEDTEETVEALIDWFFQGMEWDKVEEDEEDPEPFDITKEDYYWPEI